MLACERCFYSVGEPAFNSLSVCRSLTVIGSERRSTCSATHSEQASSIIWVEMNYGNTTPTWNVVTWTTVSRWTRRFQARNTVSLPTDGISSSDRAATFTVWVQRFLTKKKNKTNKLTTRVSNDKPLKEKWQLWDVIGNLATTCATLVSDIGGHWNVGFKLDDLRFGCSGILFSFVLVAYWTLTVLKLLSRIRLVQ